MKHYWFVSQNRKHDLKTMSDLHFKYWDWSAILTIAKWGPLKIKFKEFCCQLLGILSNIQWGTNLKQTIWLYNVFSKIMIFSTKYVLFLNRKWHGNEKFRNKVSPFLTFFKQWPLHLIKTLGRMEKGLHWPVLTHLKGNEVIYILFKSQLERDNLSMSKFKEQREYQRPTAK